MTTSTFYAVGDGRIQNNGSSWSTVRGTPPDSTTGTGTDTASAVNAVLTVFLTPNYYCRRFFASFDTSSLPDDAVISAASLFLRTYSPEGSVQAAVFEGTQASTSSLATSDFGKAGSTAFSSWISSFGADAYTEFALNSSGIAAISKTGYTKLALREKRDYDNTTPTSTWYDVNGYTSAYSGTNHDPYLSITYTTPVNGTVTVTADVMTMAGTSVSITDGRVSVTVTASPSAMTMAGTSASTSSVATVTVAAGVMTASGTAVAVTNGSISPSVTVSPSAMTMSGTSATTTGTTGSPSIDYDLTLLAIQTATVTASPGVMTLAGTSASAYSGLNATVTVASGVMTLASGPAASVTGTTGSPAIAYDLTLLRSAAVSVTVSVTPSRMTMAGVLVSLPSWTRIATLAADSTSYDDYGIVGTTSYDYRVAPVIGGSPGTYVGTTVTTVARNATVTVTPSAMTARQGGTVAVSGTMAPRATVLPGVMTLSGPTVTIVAVISVGVERLATLYDPARSVTIDAVGRRAVVGDTSRILTVAETTRRVEVEQ